MIFWAFRQMFVWLAVVVVIAVAASKLGLPTTSGPAVTEPATATPASAASATVRAVPNSLTFHAERNGHVMLEAAVNGAPVHMIVDTGATLVALSKADAAAAGIDAPNYSMTMNTANGRTRAAPVTLREVRIGQLEIDNVQGVVLETLGTPSLLGQSFLNRLESYQMRDGVLTMRW